MHRQLIGFTLALSLSTIACRKPCADTDSCLTINVNFANPELAKQVESYKVIALDQNCKVLKVYGHSQMNKVPSVIEIPSEWPPEGATQLRLVARLKPESPRLRPYTLPISPERGVQTLEAIFSTIDLPVVGTQDGLDSSRQIQYIPKTQERSEPLLLIVGAQQVQPVWVQAKPERKVFALATQIMGSECQVAAGTIPRHVSFSSSRLSYSVLDNGNHIDFCEINVKEAARAHSRLNNYDLSRSIIVPDVEWIEQTDLSTSVIEPIYFAYSKSKKTIAIANWKTEVPLGKEMLNARSGMYIDPTGKIRYYHYFENLGGKISLNPANSMTPIDLPIDWSADIVVKLADLNEDRYLDVIMINTKTNNVLWVLSMVNSPGPRDSLLWPQEIEALGQSIYIMDVPGSKDVEIGDVDGDLLPDLIVASNKKVTVYWGSGTGFSRSAKLDINDSENASTVAVGDLDGDCAAEIAIGATDKLRIAAVASK